MIFKTFKTGCLSILASLSVFWAACTPGGTQDKSKQVEYLTTQRSRELNLPFSEAVRVGNTLYLSGQLGIDYATGKLVEGGVAAETRRTMENIKAVLERHGASMESVVKCTVMMADINEWADMNSVYVTYFPKHLPARSAFGAAGLALGARLEIECLAVVE